MCLLQIRKQARLRREYLYRKGVEERQRAIQDKKDRLKRALDENRLIDGDLRRDALDLQRSGAWDDAGPQAAQAIGSESGGTATVNSQDDEYRWAGVENPKVMLTTSRDPSARLKKFVKVISYGKKPKDASPLHFFGLLAGTPTRDSEFSASKSW